MEFNTFGELIAFTFLCSLDAAFEGKGSLESTYVGVVSDAELEHIREVGIGLGIEPPSKRGIFECFCSCMRKRKLT